MTPMYDAFVGPELEYRREQLASVAGRGTPTKVVRRRPWRHRFHRARVAIAGAL